MTGDLVQKGGYEYLYLPAEFEPERRCTTSIGWSDPRTEAGELLWPERQSQKHLEDLKRTLGTYRYAGQYQQRPVQIRTSNGETMAIEAVPLPERFDQVLQSWDLSVKDQATSDFVAGGVWGALGADRYLLDQRCERLDMPATLQAIRHLSKKCPKAGLN